jgi:hypothetical protein
MSFNPCIKLQQTRSLFFFEKKFFRDITTLLKRVLCVYGDTEFEDFKFVVSQFREIYFFRKPEQLRDIDRLRIVSEEDKNIKAIVSTGQRQTNVSLEAFNDARDAMMYIFKKSQVTGKYSVLILGFFVEINESFRKESGRARIYRIPDCR